MDILKNFQLLPIDTMITILSGVIKCRLILLLYYYYVLMLYSCRGSLSGIETRGVRVRYS